MVSDEDEEGENDSLVSEWLEWLASLLLLLKTIKRHPMLMSVAARKILSLKREPLAVTPLGAGSDILKGCYEMSRRGWVWEDGKKKEWK